MHEWTYYMRPADRHSRIVVSGEMKGDWNERFLVRYAKLLKDTGALTQLKDMFHVLGLKYANEEQVRNAAALVDRYLGPNVLEISVEEWAAQTGPLPPWPQELNEMTIWEAILEVSELDLPYEGLVKMDAAVSAAGSLHGLIRNADRVKLASFLYPVNTWGPLIKTDGPRFLRTATYHVFDLLKQHMEADSIGVDFNGTSGLDVVASVSKGGRTTTVSIVNPQERAPLEGSVADKGDRGPESPSRRLPTCSPGNPRMRIPTRHPTRLNPGQAGWSEKGDEWVASCPPYSLTVVTLAGSG